MRDSPCEEEALQENSFRNLYSGALESLLSLNIYVRVKLHEARKRPPREGSELNNFLRSQRQ